MKRILIGVLTIFVFMFFIPTAVFAKVPEKDQIEAVTISPSLSFSGNTAECGVYVKGAASDSISVTLKLWRGSVLLETWTDSGVWKVSMSESKTVFPGYVYKVTADVTINGIAQSTVSKSKYH